MGQKVNVAQRTLYDIRDNNSYTIRKLADGNCWMTENLRTQFKDLDGDGKIGILSSDGATETLMTNTNTNLISKTMYYPTLETGSGSFTEEYQDNSVTRYSSGTTTTADGEIQIIGGTYNWNAATAGSGSSTNPGIWSTAPDSICPSGWRLPIGVENRRLFSTFYEIVDYESDGHTITAEQSVQIHSKPMSLIDMSSNTGYFSWSRSKSATSTTASRIATPHSGTSGGLWTWYGSEIYRGIFVRCLNI